MKIIVPEEKTASERRVPIVPQTVSKLVELGADIAIESGLGLNINIPDSEYKKAGATIVKSRDELLKAGDLALFLNKPAIQDVARLRKNSTIIGFLDPWNSGNLIKKLLISHISSFSLEFIPRTTIAQKMDALSSQANLAGYEAVVLAAERINKILPMMMTPAGTINPARVFVIGAGVAGLQAIATAKRLGARVEAFDTRPVVAEQVQSLGAKFVKIDLGEIGQTKDGYAKELTTEQIKKQQEGMAKHCAASDIVITTARLFGKKSPIIVTRDMIKGMQPGSVIVDLAVESGGNVEGAKYDQEVLIDGVLVIGMANLPARAAKDASIMYSNNVGNFVEHFWDKEKKEFSIDLDDEIIKGSLITYNGDITNDSIKKLVKGGK